MLRTQRTARLIDQMELALEKLEVRATEDELADGAASSSMISAPLCRRPVRRPFPAHLPRARVVIAAPTACPCCGSTKLSKLGEDVTETLEVIPHSWKVVQTVRERFACRACESITQPPTPFHTISRGFAGPKPVGDDPVREVRTAPAAEPAERALRPGRHRPLRLDAGRSVRCLHRGARAPAQAARHVMVAKRLHGDDTTVPILAKGGTVTGRIWTYVRNDRPLGGLDPPAALFHASRDRAGHHPENHLSGFGGILQVDAYSGYNRLYDPARPHESVTSGHCWAHARRGFFVLADVAAKARRGKTSVVISPIALEAVRRIDALFAIERGINGRSADERLHVRRAESVPLMAELEAWLHKQRAPVALLRRGRAD